MSRKNVNAAAKGPAVVRERTAGDRDRTASLVDAAAARRATVLAALPAILQPSLIFTLPPSL